MSLRTLGSGLASWLFVAALFGACVSGPEGTEGAGATGQATGAVTGDNPPHAAFSVVCIDRTCTVDAEASSDDVFITNYRWVWGDGEVTSGGSSASAPSHTYHSYVSFGIFLTVTDSAGQTATLEHDITLVQGPSAAFTSSVSNRDLTVNASSSSGPAAITGYHWDWDDETTTDTGLPSSSHHFGFGATFHVHLTVTDANGLTAGITQAVIVP